MSETFDLRRLEADAAVDACEAAVDALMSAHATVPAGWFHTRDNLVLALADARGALESARGMRADLGFTPNTPDTLFSTAS